jgi:hypothetical protein
MICNTGMLDDSPLGIYDAEFGDQDSPTSEMTKEYSVPQCFTPDIFDLATTSHYESTEINYDENNDIDDGGENDIDDDGEYNIDDDGENNIDDDRENDIGDDGENDIDDDRPPWRWILIGPERSGTGLHVDPLWTNAWVTVVQGKKRWLLFPPETPRDKIGMIDGQPQIPSSSWFHSYYDKVTSTEWPLEHKPVEVLQLPGETVFVPNGWPHIVLNLETTVAVTHNYASEFGPFERMWEEVVKDEPDFAKRWLDGMKNERPDLYHRANKDLLNV